MIPHMRVHRITLLVGLLGALAPMVCASLAQSVANADTPAAVADSFFRATEQERWRDAARLMDLATFGALRDQDVANMRNARTRVHRMTAEEFMKFDPKMPRAVARYQAARSNEQIGRNDWLLHEYADVPTVDSLAALSAEDAAARWLQAKDQRYMMRQALANQSGSCSVPDSIVAQAVHLPRPSYRELGTVIADSLAYVLYTEDMSPEATPDSATETYARARITGASYVMSPPVLTLRRVGGLWRIAPSFNMSNTGVAMIACERPKPARKPAH